jgi:tetratricopeptide (TPR) repeat protein
MQLSYLRAAAFILAVLAPVPLAAAAQSADDASLSGNYLAGRTATGLHDDDLASGYFKRALQLDTNNPALIERVFLLELADGNMAGAEDFAQRVLASNSQHRMARFVVGLRDMRAHRYGEARHNFAIASYTPVGELTGALLSAWTYAGEGELNAALKQLDKLDSNESFANFKTLNAALISDYLGNPIRAEAAYAKAHEQAGTSLRVVQSYGNFLARNGRFDEAVKIDQQFLASDDNPLVKAALADAQAHKRPQPFIVNAQAGAGESLFAMASAMTDDQNVEVGLLYTRLAITMTADKPVAYTLLGDIYENLKLPEKAVAAYQQVPQSSPLRINADMEIAVNLQRLEKKDQARATLEAIIARDPKNYNALVTLGNLHRNNEDFAKAAAVYDRAIELLKPPQKENWRVFYYDGIAYERQSQWDKAEKQFRRALELSPDEPMVLNYLGYSMVDKKLNLQEALGMIKRAVDLKPNDGYIVDSLGWAYYQLGDYEQALTNCERAVDLLPVDPIIGEHLGDVYWKVGRRLEAKFQWQHAKDNKPEPEDLKRIEDKLKNGMSDVPPVTPAQNGTGGSNG